MRLLAVLALAGCASSHTPPLDIAGVRVILLCLINCPTSVNMADEGTATDAIPIEHAHILPENMRAYNNRPVTPGKSGQ